MATSAQLAQWSLCPRCQAPLEHAERSVRCPSCGLEEYANPVPTVSAVIRDGDGRILLARRAGEPGAGLWDLLGGFMDEGEWPEAALRRELREETGLEAEPGEYLGGIPDRYGDEGNLTVNFYWAARPAAGEPPPARDLAQPAGRGAWRPSSRVRPTTWPISPGSRRMLFRPWASSRSPTRSSCSAAWGQPSARCWARCSLSRRA